MTRFRIALAFPLAALAAGYCAAADLPKVAKVDRQPLEAQVKRLVQALDLIGAPLPADDKDALAAAGKTQNDAKAVAALQTVLDKHCLAGLRIARKEKEVTLTARRGPAPLELAEQGWRVFLVKVANP